MNSCCNGGCPQGQCKCYAYDPNWKYSKYDLIISYIQTALQLFDSDSVRDRLHGKRCLECSISELNKIRMEELNENRNKTEK